MQKEYFLKNGTRLTYSPAVYSCSTPKKQRSQQRKQNMVITRPNVGRIELTQYAMFLCLVDGAGYLVDKSSDIPRAKILKAIYTEFKRLKLSEYDCRQLLKLFGEVSGYEVIIK